MKSAYHLRNLTLSLRKHLNAWNSKSLSQPPYWTPNGYHVHITHRIWGQQYCTQWIWIYCKFCMLSGKLLYDSGGGAHTSVALIIWGWVYYEEADRYGIMSCHVTIWYENAESFWENLLMERMAALEFSRANPRLQILRGTGLKNIEKMLRFWHWGSLFNLYWKCFF